MSWPKWSVRGSTTEDARTQSPRASTGRRRVPVAALRIDAHFPKVVGVHEPTVSAGCDAWLDTPLPSCFRPAAVRDAKAAACATRNLRLHSPSASHPVSCPQPACLLRSTSADTGRNSARSIILQPELARAISDQPQRHSRPSKPVTPSRVPPLERSAFESAARGVFEARGAALPLLDEAVSSGMTRRGRMGAARHPATTTSSPAAGSVGRGSIDPS